MLVGRDPAQLIGVHRDQRRPAALALGEPRLGRLEQRRLPASRQPAPAAGGRARGTRSPRAAAPHAAASDAGLARPPIPAEQQRLGQRHVVAARDPHPGAQQCRVDSSARRPDPPHIPGPLVRRHHRGKIIQP